MRVSVQDEEMKKWLYVLMLFSVGCVKKMAPVPVVTEPECTCAELQTAELQNYLIEAQLAQTQTALLDVKRELRNCEKRERRAKQKTKVPIGKKPS
jgi:hypothetical protein